MKYGLTGPVMTQVAACASGVIAFQDALRLIATGECDVVIAGGSEAPLLPMAFAALANMGALSKRNDDPQGASRPFDRTRDGFVFGEGAGVVVIESAEHAHAARRADPGRDHRRGADRRRVPHLRARADRPRRRDGDGRARCATPASARTRSTTSSPTARPRRSTT